MRIISGVLMSVLLAAPFAHAPAQGFNRDRVIADLFEQLERAYVFPAKTPEMRKLVEARRADGAYATLGAAEFAEALTADLQRVTRDKHLRVRAPGGGTFIPAPASSRAVPPVSAFGIGTPERLPGNIGYVEFRTFGHPARAVADAVAEAMNKVADADALIIDLRRNGGGSPEFVALVSSYLFGPEPVHLNSLFWRAQNRTDDFYTLREVGGKRFGPAKPVYVLTSARTFSAAEEFTYNLQARKRAVIVGETTGGGAHPGGMQRLSDGFMVFIPEGRAINPITKTNWEGTGIRPDIAVPADSALDAALAAARRKIT